MISSFVGIAGISACGAEDADHAGDDGGTAGTFVAGATASAGGAGRGGTGGSSAGRGGTGGSSAGGTSAGRGGTGSSGSGSGVTAGSAGKDIEGNAGAPEPPGGNTGESPYEIECHGDTVMCGDPTALLCLGLRAGTDVFGYSCSNECESDADCSDRPASAEASAGCVDFVNTKYCLLVCKNGDEEASCPTGMYCYVYEGSPIGYCLWR